MTDFSEIARRYIDVWNEPDADTRREAVASLWGDGGGYTDPLADVTGPEAIGTRLGRRRHDVELPRIRHRADGEGHRSDQLLCGIAP